MSSKAENMSRLKVLFITSWYPTKEQPVGGVFVREHAKAVRLYNDVAVLHWLGVVPQLKKLWVVKEESDESLTESIPTFRFWYWHSPLPCTRYVIYFYSMLRAFHYIISRGFHPDIIHAHIHDTGIPSLLIGKIHGIPVVITEHSSTFPRGMLSRLDILKARLAFGKADFVLPVSNVLQKGIERYGIRARFQVIPNVVDTTIFSPPFSFEKGHSLRRILFVGLLVPVKGVPYLFQALTKLNQKRSDWHLDIIGDGPARAEYQRLASDLSIDERVTFHGLKHKQDVAEFMRQADLFVLPSLAETFSTVAAEALTMGIPVLATQSGGPEEFINEEIGLLVPPGDAEALFNGLDYMLNHLKRFKPDQISRYATERFSPERVGEQLHKIYLECIEKYKGSYGTATQTRTYQ